MIDSLIHILPENTAEIIKISIITIIVLIFLIIKLRIHNIFINKSKLDSLNKSFDRKLKSKMYTFLVDSYEDELFYQISRIKAQGQKRLILIDLHGKINYLYNWKDIKDVLQYVYFEKDNVSIVFGSFEKISKFILFLIGISLFVLFSLLAILTVPLDFGHFAYTFIFMFFSIYGYIFMKPYLILKKAKSIKTIITGKKSS